MLRSLHVSVSLCTLVAAGPHESHGASQKIAVDMARFKMIPSQTRNCTQIMSAIAGGRASSAFGGSVAHGIHSLTVSMLQKFEPEITAKNFVPTVAMDLRSETPILDHAPLDEDSPFETEGMRLIDAALSHMDNPDWDIRGFSTLERVVHIFHMNEGVEMTLREYKAIKAAGGVSSNICACVNDVEENGIRKALRLLALQIREPTLIYNAPSLDYSFQYNFGAQLFNDKVKDPTLKPEELLLDVDDAMPELKNQSSWGIWRKLMMNMNPDMHRDAALFLYCTLTSKD